MEEEWKDGCGWMDEGRMDGWMWTDEGMWMEVGRMVNDVIKE